MHSQAGEQPVVGREPVPDELHAEVHGGVEHGVGGVYYEDQVGSGAIEKKNASYYYYYYLLDWARQRRRERKLKMRDTGVICIVFWAATKGVAV